MSDPDWLDHCGDRWRAAVLKAAALDICEVVGPSPRRPRDWVAMMRRLGVRDLSGVVTAVHGRPVSPRLATRGDIVRCGWALGICRGEVAEFYNTTLPMAEVDEAWPIGARADG